MLAEAKLRKDLFLPKSNGLPAAVCPVGRIGPEGMKNKLSKMSLQISAAKGKPSSHSQEGQQWRVLGTCLLDCQCPNRLRGPAHKEVKYHRLCSQFPSASELKAEVDSLQICLLKALSGSKPLRLLEHGFCTIPPRIGKSVSVQGASLPPTLW